MRSRGWSGRSGIRYDVNGQTSGRRGTHDRALAMIDKRTALAKTCAGFTYRLTQVGAVVAAVVAGGGEGWCQRGRPPRPCRSARANTISQTVRPASAAATMAIWYATGMSNTTFSPPHVTIAPPRREQGQGAIGLRPRVIKLGPIRP